MGGKYHCECTCGNRWLSVSGYDLKGYLKNERCSACGAKPGEGLTVLVARERVRADYYDALTGRLVHSESWERDHHEYDEAERLWGSEED